MESIMENSTYNKVKALRSEPDQSRGEFSFKKTPIGGYSCKEVEEYLKTLKSNMQLSEKTYNDKFEEFSSASKMYLQEREVLNKKIKELENEIDNLENIQSEIIAREKVGVQRAQKEILELKVHVGNLQHELAAREQNQSAAKENEESILENKRLTEEISELTESKEKLASQNASLTNEYTRITKQNEKLSAEMDDLKKTITALRISKRNAAMSTNMRVFECQQNHQLGMESITDYISDISNVLSTMKADLSDFFEKSKMDLKEENMIGHL